MLPSNPINKALQDLQHTIPVQILNLAFNPENVSCLSGRQITTDEVIKNTVIYGRVIIDADLVGGEEIVVRIAGIQPRYADNRSRVYFIPKKYTRGRSIVSALSLAPLENIYPDNYNTYTGINPVGNMAIKGMQAAGSFGPYFNAKMSIVADNTILILYENEVVEPGYIRCLIQNEENLNNISPRSYIPFSRLVELATKAYIYNKLYVTIDQAQVVGGQQIGAIKEIVDQYQDAEERYREYLDETWSKIAIMNDDESYRRFFIKSQINPFL